MDCVHSMDSIPFQGITKHSEEFTIIIKSRYKYHIYTSNLDLTVSMEQLDIQDYFDFNRPYRNEFSPNIHIPD